MPPAQEPLIRVRVGRVDRAGLQLGEAGRRVWMTGPGSGFTAMLEGPISVRRTPRGWVVRWNERGRTRSRAINAAERLTMAAFDRRTEGIVFRDRRLAGTVMFVPAGDEDIDVVCQLPMERYLPGVLAGELFATWRDATHESLGIAARSYALCERFHWLRRRSFDVQADERSQVWVGVSVEPRARRAVEATRGQVLVWRGLVIPGYYSAACGGRPAEATLAISSNPVNAIPPLGVPDSDRRPPCGCRRFGSHGSWSVDLDGQAVVSALRAWARKGGPASWRSVNWPVEAEVISDQRSGRPARWRLVSRSGAVAEVGAIELQRLLNAEQRGRPLRSADLRIENRPEGWRVGGAGFGHGVGLCQYGAESMARAGAGREAILARYYPRAVIARAWS